VDGNQKSFKTVWYQMEGMPGLSTHFRSPSAHYELETPKVVLALLEMRCAAIADDATHDPTPQKSTVFNDHLTPPWKAPVQYHGVTGGQEPQCFRDVCKRIARPSRDRKGRKCSCNYCIEGWLSKWVPLVTAFTTVTKGDGEFSNLAGEPGCVARCQHNHACHTCAWPGARTLGFPKNSEMLHLLIREGENTDAVNDGL